MPKRSKPCPIMHYHRKLTFASRLPIPPLCRIYIVYCRWRVTALWYEFRFGEVTLNPSLWRCDASISRDHLPCVLNSKSEVGQWRRERRTRRRQLTLQRGEEDETN